MTEEEWLKRSQVKANKKGLVYDEARQRDFLPTEIWITTERSHAEELDASTRKRE